MQIYYRQEYPYHQLWSKLYGCLQVSCQKYNVLCIEGKYEVSGLWYFNKVADESDPSLKTDAYMKEYGYQAGSIYENLILNGIKVVQVFKGFPAKLEYDYFMKFEDFMQYLLECTKTS
ncbi:hypothetical protein ABPG74_008476 [Tetrahymena malaccensis]